MNKFTLVLSLLFLFASSSFAEEWTSFKNCNQGAAELKRITSSNPYVGVTSQYQFIIRDSGVIQYFKSKGLGKSDSFFAQNFMSDSNGEKLVLAKYGAAGGFFPYFTDIARPTIASREGFLNYVEVKVSPKDGGILVQFNEKSQTFHFENERIIITDRKITEIANWFFESCL